MREKEREGNYFSIWGEAGHRFINSQGSSTGGLIYQAP